MLPWPERPPFRSRYADSDWCTWTDFFQPGVIGKHNAIIRNTNHYNKLLPATGDYKIPGKIYENSIESLTLNSNSANTLEKTGYFNK